MARITDALPEAWREDRTRITEQLRRHGAEQQRGDSGETWWNHHCLFHDDHVRSASWQEDTGVYYCHAEDHTYAVPEVLAELSTAPALQQQRTQTRTETRTRTRTRTEEDQVDWSRVPLQEFVYSRPDGTPSWSKYRQQAAPGLKKTWGRRPEDAYPLYGEALLGEGPHILLVVEGEPKVDAVFVQQLSLDHVPVRALTAGSAADVKRSAAFLARRCQELGALWVLCWPDNDEPGVEAMKQVAAELAQLEVAHQTLRPSRYRLPLHGDLLDFLYGGGDLLGLLREHQPAPQQSHLQQLVQELAITAYAQVILPQSRQPWLLNLRNCRALWLQAYGEDIKDGLARQLEARLLIKSAEQPTPLYWRCSAAPDRFWWRPDARQRCYEVSAQGVDYVEDPPTSVITTPLEPAAFSAEVDLDSSSDDLSAFCAEFGLSELDQAMVEGWLLAAFLGLQAPIMFMRGSAGTGKTTLARLLLALLEPSVPMIRLSPRGFTDERQLVRSLQRSPGLLLDNVSVLSAENEDLLSTLVTGMNTLLRTLYGDTVESINLHRALILTTTNYDPYKGDLANRMVVVESRPPSEGYYDDRLAQEYFGAMLPRLRGYIFKQAQLYYQRLPQLGRQSFRIASLGSVFEALGYDVQALAQQESKRRSQVISQDPWTEAIAALWEEQQEQGVSLFERTPSEVLEHMRREGIAQHELPSAKRLVRWIAERNPVFRDFGFSVEAGRSQSRRYYRFQAAP